MKKTAKELILEAAKLMEGNPSLFILHCRAAALHLSEEKEGDKTIMGKRWWIVYDWLSEIYHLALPS